MSNSPLVEFTQISPNQSGLRDHEIDGIAIHCVVGQCYIESLGALFSDPSLQASSNYGIGFDGKVGMFVPEANRAWTTSSYKVDRRCVTIEVASDTYDPFAVYDAPYKKLLDLVEDICRRNNIKKLGWSWEESERKAWANGTDNGFNMQVHRDWAWKSCPGEWLYSRHQSIADEVNRRLNAEPDPKPEPTPAIKAGDIVKIKSGARYTNGKLIPVMILAEEWIVKSVSGDVALIDKSVSGGWSINSTVNTEYLVKVDEDDDGFKPYLVRVKTDCLNIRKGHGTNTKIIGQITDHGIYTIVEEAEGRGASLWGRLKAGGWIALDYCERVK